jgi:membrane protease YdiL (CAAX protease family)
MLGIIIQLLLSYALIYFFDNRRLGVLGWQPNQRRMTDFFIFLFVSMGCCAMGFVFRIFLAQESWMLNPSLNIKLLWNGLWWNIKSVLFEELIFRGVLFFLMIKWLGKLYAVLIASFSFGIYHWFSFEIIGNISAMLQVFLSTSIVGFLYAWGYVKSGSLYSTIAMHLGWNFTQGFAFSSGSIGKGIWMLAKPSPQITVHYGTYFLIFYFPILCFILLNFLLLHVRNKKGSLLMK